jgi:hypothetical protein
MSTPWRTVRVFISSTFRDMHAEQVIAMADFGMRIADLGGTRVAEANGGGHVRRLREEYNPLQ